MGSVVLIREKRKLEPAGWMRIATVISATVASGVILFAAAGRLDWTGGWIYLGVHFGCVTAASIFLLVTNPELLNQRGRRHSNTKTFDKVFAAFYVLLLMALPLVAGLDAARFGWSSMSRAALAAGVLLFGAGEAPIIWSMAVNPFLEATVRIQSDRGHRVISAGPYRFVRHPMYVGLILQHMAVPLILGSKWAYVPAGLIALLFIMRARLEDRTLRRELEGYLQYAHSTRYLLLPGIW
jgi:protein-S-isoprenylcysteine O-methyltransferase Ste14